MELQYKVSLSFFCLFRIRFSDFTEAVDGSALVANQRDPYVKSPTGFQFYDLRFRPPLGILNSSIPLCPKTDFGLYFDRADSSLGLIAKTSGAENPLENQPIELENVFLKATYVTSPNLRNFFSSIENTEISYKYDETLVYVKSLPRDQVNINLPNLIGGNTPNFLLAGIIKTDAIQGNQFLSSTCFQRNGVEEFDLLLDGYSVQGFPLRSDRASPIEVYQHFLKETDRTFNNSCGSQLCISDFVKFHYLYVKCLIGENSDNGWLGVNLKLDKAFDENYSLGISLQFSRKKNNIFLVLWCSHDIDLKLDRFRRIEKLIL